MLLETVHSPRDLKNMLPEKLPLLAEEIRQRIIDVVSSTGGHLASSLGAVELAIALHYCLDTPTDKIIWDVGHQAYAHKILTGRNKDFTSLRQRHGLSGFPCKDESSYDSFTTGHSSTAVSLALGLVCARDLLPQEEHFRVVAVIGDGSLSGGLCFEGLNNAGHLKKDMLVVLNTNELSIAPNVGALSTYLNKLISLPVYNRFRSSLEEFLKARVPRGSRLINLANKFEEGLKGLFIPGMLFEELGFRYFGPLDGHNLPLLIKSLKNISSIKGPVMLHVVTQKGKGYVPAEQEPVKFHGIGPFEIETGSAVSGKGCVSCTYTRVFGDTLVELAKTDRKIVAITAAMPEGTGLDKFRDAYPERFFDVGIAEEHAVCFAAGLARRGLKPVVAIYSTFLQRAYDQLIECVALQGLGVVFAVDRAGIVGEDGATHQGIFDISFLRDVPGMVIMAAKNGLELKKMLYFACMLQAPAALRYPRDRVPEDQGVPTADIELGKAEVLREGKDAVLFALGAMVMPSLEAASALKRDGIDVAVINARFVRPLDTELLHGMAGKSGALFTVEEGIVDGGLGSAVSAALNRPVVSMGLPCGFLPCGRRGPLLKEYGLTAEGIADKVRQTLSGKNRKITKGTVSA
ncbi:MAG TPA: 1-deoxy-D-xylulose-5-phosphate synthase [Patescibacteria group bacterium]|nr:1-deoxy-D-xylulose-5-phosphate synthase [Patescibacteria group bacterium]